MRISISIKILLSLLVPADRAKGAAKAVDGVGLWVSNKLVLVAENALAGRAKNDDLRGPARGYDSLR